MSTKLMSGAWGLTLRPRLKLVCLALADMANDEGLVFADGPVASCLAERLNLSVRSVGDGIVLLDSMGLITREAPGRISLNLREFLRGK